MQSKNAPLAGVFSYVTLGVSNHRLALGEDREVRQEFLLCANSETDVEEAAWFLLRFSDMVLQRHKAIPYGEVIGPGKPLFAGTALNAVYATHPTLYPEGLHIYDGMDPPVVVTWLVPIYGSEVDFITAQRPEPFERLLAERSNRFWDMNRKPVV